MIRHIIIGDVHGCIDELDQLIKKLNLKNSDKLYFIGDLIDKGPDSPADVKKVYQLSLSRHLILILGNHEEKFLRYKTNREFNSKSLAGMIISDEFERLIIHLTTSEMEMLKNAYLYYAIPDTETVLVHGGFPEQITLNTSRKLKWKDTPKQILKKMRMLTMTRMLNVNTDFIGLNDVFPNMYFWADKYDGRFGKAIFGQQPFVGLALKFFPNAIGIDTGCVFGGSLSAVIIHSKNEHELVCQPAYKRYCL